MTDDASCPRTSFTHPLRIDSVETPDGGVIGMTFCPGKVSAPGGWQRDLDLDLDAVRDWGALAVVTLVEAGELDRYQVARLGPGVLARGMRWHHLPIADYGIPGPAFEGAWEQAGADLHATLRQGGRVLLHCAGGLGRTGTIAVRLLVEQGLPPEQAIRVVRQARPGTLETEAQLAYARAARPL